jgi:UDP-N-acetylglucosamine 2-epimerase
VPTLDRAATFAALGLAPRPRNLLITFHRATLDEVPGETQFGELAAALEALGPDVGVILTGSNADPEGQCLTRCAEAFAAKRANAVFHVSLGQKLYYSALRHVNAIVGNSSSGLYEAPSFGIGTVNIGERQTGRLRAASVMDAAPERGAIGRAIAAALAGDFRGVVNPYGDGHASERIVARLAAISRPADLLAKRFYEGS